MPIQWAAREWHQVALVWSGGGPTVLYLDGLTVAAGAGLHLSALGQFPGTPGFCIGSDAQGTRLAQGQFEEVYTFSRACTAEELAWNWQVQRGLAARGPISEEETKALLESVAQLKSMSPADPVDVVIGFSWSSCNSPIGAYYSFRTRLCTAMEGPVLIKAGKGHSPWPRWGDYSYTSLDSGDPEHPDVMSIWTVQEYAWESLYPLDIFLWGTSIARIRPFD